LPSVGGLPRKIINKDSGNSISPFTSLGLLTNRSRTAQTDRARVGTGEKEMDPEEINGLDEPLLADEGIALGETQSVSKLGRSISIDNEPFSDNLEA
jgi:hypothetical protein